MFGLENKKQGKGAEFAFEFEKEFSEHTAQKEITSKILDKLGIIKGALHTGGDAAMFNDLGKLLFGYTALLKVVYRAKGKR